MKFSDCRRKQKTIPIREDSKKSSFISARKKKKATNTKEENAKNKKERTIVKLSPKTLEVLAKHKNAKINLLHGTVRSGKTFTANYVALKEDLMKMPAGNVLVTGFSSDSAKQNIITEWEKLLGVGFKEHRDSNGTYYTVPIRGLSDKKFLVRGGGKNGDEKGIKGVTLIYWYADEITEHTETFVDMANSRLSLDISKAIWTTNPGGPANHIKLKFLDREEELGDQFQSFQFELFDNPSIGKQYIDGQRKMYHGVFYERNIRGRWVAAEGYIYNMIDEDNVTKTIPSNPDRILIGIDYGTANSTSFVKAYIYGDFLYIVDEFEHSGRENRCLRGGVETKEGIKSPTDYVDELKRFIGNDPVNAIYADPSAAFFVKECKKAGITGFRNADNEVSVISGTSKLGRKA